MTTNDRWQSGSVIWAIVLAVIAGAVFYTPAQARKEDSEPRVTDTFGRSNRKVRSNDVNVLAVNAALLKKYSDAFAYAKKSKNSLTRKTVEWIYLRDKPKDAGYDRLMAFVKANPNWPKVNLLASYAEKRLLWGNAPIAKLAAHFDKHKPRYSTGWAALAKLRLSRGQKKRAHAALRKAWFNTSLPTETKTIILRQMPGILTKADHERRLWLLIHAQKSAEAVKTAGLISKNHIVAARAARALVRRQKHAMRLYKNVPSKLRGKLALQYALARYYRKTRKPVSALAILKNVSVKTSATYNQAAWWVERRLIVRELIGTPNRKYWPSLYQQSRRHGFKSGKHFEEGEFLSGWIALRKLGKAKLAVGHLTRMAAKAKSRTQQSRGSYWAARAYLVLGNKAKADFYMKKAAKTPTLFYALLARESLGLGRTPIKFGVVRPSAKIKSQVSRLELVRAVRLLHRSGGDRELGSFVWPIAKLVKSKTKASAAAELMHSYGGPHLALRLAKAVGAYGVDIDNWAYPVRAMPKIKLISRPVEKSVIYALSRQESEFNAKAKSYVGARGLMQIMPSTGKWLAKKYKLRHTTSRLTSEPSYNVMMGSAYLSDIIHQFNGSYILSFGGYNAGPGNAKKWIRKYGDPRGGKVDSIDWIESIPITETRKYMQKVMQNVHIYRSRLDPRAMTGMKRDLMRGKPDVITSSGKRKVNSKCGGRKTLTSLFQDC